MISWWRTRSASSRSRLRASSSGVERLRFGRRRRTPRAARRGGGPHRRADRAALESLSRAPECLRPRPLKVLLHAREAIGPPVDPAGAGEDEVVAGQVHARAPLARRYAASSRAATAAAPNADAAVAATGCELRPEVRIGQDLIDGGREGLRVLGHEQTRDAVGHDFLDAARPDGHHRQPAGHRLQDGEALRLGRRGEYERVRRAVVGGEAVRSHATTELDPITETPNGRQPAERLRLGPPPHQDEPDPGLAHAGDRVGEELEVLLPIEAADVEEYALPRPRSRASGGPRRSRPAGTGPGRSPWGSPRSAAGPPAREVAAPRSRTASGRGPRCPRTARSTGARPGRPCRAAAGRSERTGRRACGW